jgi:hypothetical protein
LRFCDRYAELRRAARDLEAFYRQVVQQPAQLDVYVEALNALAPPPVWWFSVAYPALEPMWKS